MSVCKPKFHELISQDPKEWSGILWVSEQTIMKLISGKGTVRLETAEKILKSANEYLNENWSLEDVFDISKLGWIESERSKVTYEYGAAPLSENDKAGIIRFLLEGKFDGFHIHDLIWILLVVGIVSLVIAILISLS